MNTTEPTTRPPITAAENREITLTAPQRCRAILAVIREAS